MEYLATKCNGQIDEIDTDIMQAIQRSEIRAGTLIRNIKITYSLWATCDYMNARGKQDDSKCPLCNAETETPGHLKANCPDETVQAIRDQVIKDIATDIEAATKENMPHEVWIKLANMWSKNPCSARSLTRDQHKAK
jgi:hypothetical protein